MKMGGGNGEEGMGEGGRCGARRKVETGRERERVLRGV